MQNIKNTVVGVVLIALVAFVGYKYFDSKKNLNQLAEQGTELPSPTLTNPSVLPSVTSSPKVSPTTQVVKTYTFTEISKHNTSSDCWTVVSGKVYDVTQFIPSHPGGKDIVKACGKDGTRLFQSEDEHVEQNAMASLEVFFIGTQKN